MIIALILGIAIGLLLNPENGLTDINSTGSLSNWLNLPGQIFMKLVQMVMIPLIIASIVSGIVSNVSDNLKTFGLGLLGYFVFTTIVSISLGATLTYFLEPGQYILSKGGLDVSTSTEGSLAAADSLEKRGITETISELVPVNPLESMLTGEMLSIVIFAVIIGIALTKLKKTNAKPIMRLIESIEQISMTVVGWAMRLVPYAVFGLTAALASEVGAEVFLGLAYYMGVVIIGLFLLLLFYSLIIVVLGKKNPLKFFGAIKDVQLLAFSTASSAAVMPLTMKTADEKLGVSSNVSDFIIPIGATINMDGTALFQCATVIFIMQVYGFDINLITVLPIIFTVLSASIGTPAVPGGGVIILASVLGGIGIPAEGLLIIIGVDRILGMFRTAVNVTGDLTACVVFERWLSNKSLNKKELAVEV
ncbi:MAG: dicarboxylate/amino acid:cation symporter [Candidatus Kapaibacteriales bacterium]